MKYLLTLNRFDIDRDKLKQKIGEFYEDNGLIVDELKNIDITEIDKVYFLCSNWKSLDFNELKQDILNSLKLVHGKTFFAKTKFFDKIKISSKSIVKKVNSLMKKENIPYVENGEIEIFIQFKRDKDIMYRLLMRENKVSVDKYNPDKLTVILEEPGSVIEISDFLRICWVFKLPLIIITRNSNKFDYLLNKAKKMTKGIPYENFDLKIMENMPKEFIKIGFSIKSKNNEKDLMPLLQKKNIALVFGDEKFGLTQDTRNLCDHMVRLTSEPRKPLRASHALSYVLGLYHLKH